MGENNGVGDGLVNRPPHIDGVGASDDMATPKSKRTTSPAYQHYASDFLSDDKVCRMSFTEIGIYQVLLDHSWLGRGLPNDTAQIAKMLKMPHSRFLRLWTGVLSECFIEKSGRLVNPRLERERVKQDEYRRRQSDNGSKGGRPPRNPNASGGLSVGSVSLSSGKARALKTEDPSGVDVLQKEEEPNDLAFRRFQSRYPGEGRKGGRLIEELFNEKADKAGGSSVLLDALENHIASERWSNPKYIPGMEVWLKEERWLQVLPPTGIVTSSQSNPKTAGNIPAFQRFIDRGKAS